MIRNQWIVWGLGVLEGFVSRIGSAAMALNYALGLPPLTIKPVCMGYWNACVCAGCKDRARKRADGFRPVPPQPWEIRRAA